MLRVTNNNIIR